MRDLFLIPLLIIFFAVGCKRQAAVVENEQSGEVMGLSLDSIRTLDRDSLIQLLGKPSDCDTFLLNDGANEFWGELCNIFTPEYLKSDSVVIVENTWSVNTLQNFTVWYRLNQDTLQPVDSCHWRNAWEF